MPRRKISEYRAKNIVSNALEISYVGWSVSSDTLTQDVKKIDGFDRYVVKVDQAVKGRFKNGLVLLDVPKKDIVAGVKTLAKKGYHSFIVEPYVQHDGAAERYIALSYDRQGLSLSVSEAGGVDIESNPDSVKTFRIDESTNWKQLTKISLLDQATLQTLVDTFKKSFFVFLEINPYLIEDGKMTLLDCAVEIDDAAAYFVNSWSEVDIRAPKLARNSKEEIAISTLDANSPASFTLEVINPDGAIFLLLSGGGASVVIADEVYNQGFGKQLANYGEYSGNPNMHETYLYTSEVLKLLIQSKAPRKVVFIGGAVANFTDIANTFAGIIAAIEEHSTELSKQQVKIYVRRGGPRQEIGLEKIRLALAKHDLLGGVYDPSTTLTNALNVALKGLES